VLYENEEIKKKQEILLKKKENYNEKYKSIIGISQAHAMKYVRKLTVVTF
jgi:hypothetical protein